MEEHIMPKRKYTSEFKSKIVLTVLQGEKDINKISAEHVLNPMMVRKWKQDFLANAYLAFGTNTERKTAQRKEEDLKKKNDQMLKTIGQLTLERDFLQDCFRQAGAPIPPIPDYDQKES